MAFVRTFCLAWVLSLGLAVSACSEQSAEPRVTRKALSQAQTIATDFLRTELALSPEMATSLDLERYLGPTAIYQLDNYSQAGFERKRLLRIELLQRLQSRPRLPSDHKLARDLAIAETALIDLIALEQLGYGRFTYASFHPYAIDPYSGVWLEGPALLAYKHPINNTGDALAYVARLQALSAAIDDTRRRLNADQSAGLQLPQALAEETQRRIEALVDGDSRKLDLLSTTFDALTLDIDGLEPTERTKLSALVAYEVDQNLRPAYRRLGETLQIIRDKAPEQAGIWAQPQGFDLYKGILKAATGGAIPTDRLHQRQSDEVEKRRAALTAWIEAPEASEETPPERLSRLLPWFEERVSEETLTDSQTPLTTKPSTSSEAIGLPQPKTVLDLIEEAPSFPAQGPTFVRYQDLLLEQPYLTWRTEGEGELMPYRQILEYPAIVAGSQLYVWDRMISDSTSSPLEEIAAQSIGLTLSALATADTGIHLERWSVAQATDFIAVNTGLSEPLARQLTLRVVANPGRFAASLATYHRFNSLSERAQAVLGTRYSETDFQRTLFQPGPRPLPMIETDIEAWYAQKLSN